MSRVQVHRCLEALTVDLSGNECGGGNHMDWNSVGLWTLPSLLGFIPLIAVWVVVIPVLFLGRSMCMNGYIIWRLCLASLQEGLGWRTIFGDAC